MKYDPETTLSIYPEKNIIKKDTCTPVFIAALSTMVKTWKQPKWPSTDEWIKKMWYVCIMEYYSAIKRNEFESALVRWINLEPAMQSKVRKRKTNTVY